MDSITKLTPSQRLRGLLADGSLHFMMECHNGLSARIGEEAGFEALWASSLTVSASYGLRDVNEASWSTVLDTLGQICDAVDVPILLDGDTGYGNFNNARYVSKQVQKAGAAGICIEDKVFPKCNSLLDKNPSSLADPDEFAGRINAIRDTVSTDLVIVARTEALVVGAGVLEALGRAELYCNAGADAIFVHTADASPAEILDFTRRWQGRCPLIIAPTTYCKGSISDLPVVGVSFVIWANHLLRASISAMRTAARSLRNGHTVSSVEKWISSVDDVFDLQRFDELRLAELRYSQGSNGLFRPQHAEVASVNGCAGTQP